MNLALAIMRQGRWCILWWVTSALKCEHSFTTIIGIWKQIKRQSLSSWESGVSLLQAGMLEEGALALGDFPETGMESSCSPPAPPGGEIWSSLFAAPVLYLRSLGLPSSLFSLPWSQVHFPVPVSGTPHGLKLLWSLPVSTWDLI